MVLVVASPLLFSLPNFQVAPIAYASGPPTPQNVTLIDAESFEGTWPPTGWSENPSDSYWNKESDYAKAGSYSADFNHTSYSSRSGDLDTPSLNCSGATYIYVEFWWMDTGLDNDDFLLKFYDGSNWDTIQDMNLISHSENVWTFYSLQVTDNQYFVSTFKVRWSAVTVRKGEHIYVDVVTVKKEMIADTPPATIWTDKADYEYYETVTIFGSGFEALANVTVTIVRPDGASDTVCAVTDDVGNFTCTYQLNGMPGTYTATATDGTNTATTTFREGAITPELYGYTLEPSPGWTHGDVKGYYECEWVPYKIEVTSSKKGSYQLTVVVHHDYNDSTWLGLDDVRNWMMWRNGVSETPTISGLVKDGWESGIQQLQWSWTFTINEDDNCTLMFETHVAIGAHNYPGSKVHTHIHDIKSVPCTPISGGHRDVPIVVKGPPLCSVTFYTEPSTVGNISFQGGTYTNGQVDTFTYGTSGPATANAPAGWEFDHWEATGNVQVSSTTANPTTVTITCGGTLKAFFRQVTCTVTFYTDPSTVGSISFGGKTYTNGQSDTFTYGTSGSATANAPIGWEFDHWEVTGNVAVSDPNTSPTTVTITCGGTLKAVFRQIQCTVTFYNDPSTIGSISFEGDIYFDCDSDTFTYSTSGPATANAPEGWEFDHWEVTGNVDVSDPNTNPTTVTVTCGGTLKAVFKQITCDVTFLTDPDTVGSITFMGGTYTNGQSDTFAYGTSGLATANAPTGWIFDHWETVGNIQVSSTTANPTTVTVTCGGSLKAVFKQIQCTVTFYTDPSTVGSISFQGGTYTHGQSGIFPYGTSGPATANVPAGWVFDHWEVSGNVQVSSTTANPTTVTIKCGGTLKAFFKRVTCTVTFYTDPSTVGSISFGGKTYTNGQSDSFTYDTSGPATANAPTGWEFDHWEATGNVRVSSTTANPTIVTITCGGTLKAFFKVIPPPVGGYAVPIDKSHFLAPKMGLAPRIGLAFVLLAALAATILLAKRRSKPLK